MKVNLPCETHPHFFTKKDRGSQRRRQQCTWSFEMTLLYMQWARKSCKIRIKSCVRQPYTPHSWGDKKQFGIPDFMTLIILWEQQSEHGVGVATRTLEQMSWIKKTGQAFLRTPASIYQTIFIIGDVRNTELDTMCLYHLNAQITKSEVLKLGMTS